MRKEECGGLGLGRSLKNLSEHSHLFGNHPFEPMGGKKVPRTRGDGKLASIAVKALLGPKTSLSWSQIKSSLLEKRSRGYSSIES